jgi:uncharacterized membrane protein
MGDGALDATGFDRKGERPMQTPARRLLRYVAYDLGARFNLPPLAPALLASLALTASGVLLTLRPPPTPLVPTVALPGALALTAACVLWLVVFVQASTQPKNVRFITDRIARETERTIDVTMPEAIDARPFPEAPPPAPFEGGTTLLAEASGYIRFIDIARLVWLAKMLGTVVRVERQVGQFVAAGTPLLTLSSSRRPAPLEREELLDVVDLGPTRTLEQDVEFGVLQLVDIALEAIAPAVNDRGTVLNCIDQLSRVMVRVAARRPAPRALYRPPGALRVTLPPVPFARLLDAAFTQIRHHARGDIAVCQRLLHALGDIASSTRDPAHLAALRDQASLVSDACEGKVAGRGHASPHDDHGRASGDMSDRGRGPCAVVGEIPGGTSRAIGSSQRTTP